MDEGAKQANTARERQSRDYFKQQVIRRLDRIIELLEKASLPLVVDHGEVHLGGDAVDARAFAQQVRSELIQIGRQNGGSDGIGGH